MIILHRGLPDDILVNHEAISYFADFGALVTYPLDSPLRDGTTGVTSLADICVVEIVVNDCRCSTAGELSWQDLESIVLR